MRENSKSSRHWSDDEEDDAKARRKSARKIATSCVPKEASAKAMECRKLAKRGLRVGRSPVGKAVFATRKILDGTCIGEIEGEVIFDDTYASRYAFDLENGAQLEPAAPFRFVNHSCEPNCAFDLIGINQADGQDVQHLKHDATATPPGRKLLIFAINDIECGEELTIDYNWPASFAIRCHCKAASCRGWIVSRKGLDRIHAAQAEQQQA